MGKVHERIDGRLRAFIERQHMFFVATAPSGPDGHVNVSPKGLGGAFAVGFYIITYWATAGFQEARRKRLADRARRRALAMDPQAAAS